MVTVLWCPSSMSACKLDSRNEYEHSKSKSTPIKRINVVMVGWTISMHFWTPPPPPPQNPYVFGTCIAYYSNINCVVPVLEACTPPPPPHEKSWLQAWMEALAFPTEDIFKTKFSLIFCRPYYTPERRPEKMLPLLAATCTTGLQSMWQ